MRLKQGNNWVGRAGRIRTADLLVPNQALFRAKPPPAGHRGYRLGRQLGILSLRSRQLRALLQLFGVPLLLGGDESGRTQQGNNDAYCQDSAITWFDWSAADLDLLAFPAVAGGGGDLGAPVVHARGHGDHAGRLG